MNYFRLKELAAAVKTIESGVLTDATGEVCLQD